MDTITIIGFGLTIIGLILTYYQIRKTRKAAEAAKLAADEAKRNIKHNIYISDISSCLKEIDSLQNLIRNNRIEVSILKIDYIKAKIIQIRGIENKIIENNKRQFREHLIQLKIIKEDLEGIGIFNDKKISNPRIQKINKILSEISDNLLPLIRILQFNNN
jgi:hypothetical protein